MRKGQNRKVKIARSGSAWAGWAGCLGLLALGMALVNPMATSVYADEVEDAEPGEVDYGNQVMPMSETSSTVNIAFLPTAASGSVTPVNAGGDKAKVDVKATVRVQNSGGYSVYLGSSSSQLVNGANVIDPVEAATTYANLPVNSWGYAFIKNGGASNDNTTYNAMPATLRSTALDTNTSTNITDETRTYTLSFAANIGNDKPAGTYKNSVTMSVVSSPLVVAEEFAYDFGGITTMQAMTTTICNAAPTGGVKQLQDTRDGKYYWVGKMKDGKCWMTQNLDLDLSKNKALTSADSDVTDDWTPGYDTATVANVNTILADNAGQRSWSLGNYSIINPASEVSCGDGLESVGACVGEGTANRFRYYVTPTTANGDINAHYTVGNYYQWNAVAAGGSVTTGQTTSSICSKGWTLPETGEDADGNYIITAGSMGGLINAYSVGNDIDKLIGAPLYFVRGGAVYQSDSILLGSAGATGRYWLGLAHSAGLARCLTFNAGSVHPFNANSRYVGYSVRCVAR